MNQAFVDTWAWVALVDKKDSDQDFSYVDCASFAVMRNLALQEAFTNDQHFRIFGFITHP